MRHTLRSFRLRTLTVVGPLLALIGAATAAPGYAQVDVSGEWAATFHEDLAHRGGMRLGDFTGLPLNEAGIRKGLAWDEDARSMRERQCVPHVVTYAMRGPANIRLSKMVDPDSGRLIAYSMQGTYGRPRTIWMDGRPHPSDLAPHTWVGFSTGKWERNALVVTTTHVKAGWLQRNGSPTSDLTTMTEFFSRYDNNLLVVHILNDPVYLAEPFIRSTNFGLSLTGNANAWGTCSPAQVVDELPDRKTGHVPHYLPGETAHVDDFLKDTGLPAAGVRGGAETTYPEFALKLQSTVEPFPGRPPRRREHEPCRGGRSSIHRRSAHPAGTGKRVHAGRRRRQHRCAGGQAGCAARGHGLGTDDRQGARRYPSTVGPADSLHPEYPRTSRPYRWKCGDCESRKSGWRRPGRRGSHRDRRVGHRPRRCALRDEHDRRQALDGSRGRTSDSAYIGDLQDVFLNGEAVQLLHQPAAHTNGDSVVFFRKSDVIVTGDIVDLTSYPVIDARSGGTFGGVLDALNRIIDLAVPEDWQDGGTLVIPSHGRMADESDVVEYRDMVTIVRDRIEDMIAKKMTLEQIKAARPTFEYDGRYGSTTGPWTTDMFVEAVYRDLDGEEVVR